MRTQTHAAKTYLSPDNFRIIIRKQNTSYKNVKHTIDSVFSVPGEYTICEHTYCPTRVYTEHLSVTVRCLSNLLSELLSNLLAIAGNHRYTIYHIFYLIRTNLSRTADL